VPRPESPPELVPPTRRRALLEIALAYLAVTVAAMVLYRIDRIYQYYSAIVAAMLLYVPVLILRRGSLSRYGLTEKPLVKNLTMVAIAVAIVFPIFFGGFLAWEKVACASKLLRPLALGCVAPGTSMFHYFKFRLPADPAETALHQLIVVALPEEFFFRGFVQGRLADVWTTRKFLGAPVGPVVVASALFAVCHLAVQLNFATLAVFFPGLLFGWMRARSGSVLPGTLFHALCNLYIETLHRSFFV
jgi:membrane protease YdiL (CAAX protease family)